MRKGFRNALAAGLVVTLFFGVTWMILRAPPDPVYEGKRLSVWLQTFSSLSSDQRAQKKAEEAVRAIGTNAIPRLLMMLQAKDSDLQLQLISLAERQHLIKIHYISAYWKNTQAFYGIKALGPSASNAVPELIRIFRLNNSPDSQAAVVGSFGAIGPPAKSAIPLVIAVATTNTNALVCYASLWVLGEMRSESEIVVPALIKFLHDPRSEMRCDAACAVTNFGLQARPAIPSLVELLKDQNAFVRHGPPTLSKPSLLKLSLGQANRILFCVSKTAVTDRRYRGDIKIVSILP